MNDCDIMIDIKYVPTPILNFVVTKNKFRFIDYREIKCKIVLGKE